MLVVGGSLRVGAGVGDENRESCGVVFPLHIPLVIRPVHRAYVVVVSMKPNPKPKLRLTNTQNLNPNPKTKPKPKT